MGRARWKAAQMAPDGEMQGEQKYKARGGVMNVVKDEK
jgi:hypothetical protein